jgi:hypothetical protein
MMITPLPTPSPQPVLPSSLTPGFALRYPVSIYLRVVLVEPLMAMGGGR